ncbi:MULTISPECIES: sensor histidine kinase [Myroides]|uniref:histidine kinase n=1 Tax=Myroides albus TaxID=2562892 RepID=A0A6I3LJA6_9FLAO|nr:MULTISPECIES: ATP-binding protein [Myroides]MTG98658.1 GHKL domain-containing protein [Myroides albus]MVX36441.1 GHKL domain-containing protein [Myroides sp. LoEW2-1]
MSFHIKAFLRIFTILLLGLLAVVVFEQKLNYSLVLISFVIIMLFVEFYYFQKKYYNTIDRVVLAMLYEDYSLKTSKPQKNDTFDNLQKLYHKLQNDQMKNEVKELVYLNILNSLETGIIIFERKVDTWELFLVNNYFSELFDIPKVKTWYNLNRLLPSLTNHITQLGFKESKGSIDLQIENENKQTFMLQTSKTVSHDQEYFIVLLDSIQNVLDKKEKDTWENLMKIISHEIMNSLTPIHSLAHNTQQILNDNTELTSEDLEDIKISVQTIVNRTDHLKHFIDNYRRLTMLPSPKKQITNLKSLLNNSIETLQPLFKKSGISVKVNLADNVLLNVDKQQIEQVFINLLTNAIYAVLKQPTKQITVDLYEKNNRIYIDFTDSGSGIAEEIQHKIFIPFYTTREEGAGIGLPLSKNIVEMHNGYLTYHRREERTVFSLNFPLY